MSLFRSQSLSKAVIALSLLCCQTLQARPFVLFNESDLQQLKQQVANQQLNEKQQANLKKLLAQADDYIQRPNPTVMDKTLLPPTNDKHDYLSISRYWWPDPAKADGLPWIRKDGITNPDTQTDAVDRLRLDHLTKGVKTLALAYYLTNEASYSEKANSMLKTWFIADETRMNPHLSFSQSVPGNANSRRAGILDGRLIPEHILDSLALLNGSEHWSEQDQQAMDAWMKDYLAWLTDSKVGKQGAQQTNNHGSWYKFQIAALAHYLGDEKQLKQVIKDTKASLAEQFDENGGQPHELSRTRSYFYSTFNLEALLSIATIAEHAKMPFWDHQIKGRSIPLAIDYLLPALQGTAWPHAGGDAIQTKDLIPVLAGAMAHYPTKDYQVIYQGLVQNYTATQTVALRYPELLL